MLEEIVAIQPPLPLPEAMSRVLDVIDVQVGPDGNFPLAVQVWAEATLDPAIGEIVRERYIGMRAVVRDHGAARHRERRAAAGHRSGRGRDRCCSG